MGFTDFALSVVPEDVFLRPVEWRAKFRVKPCCCLRERKIQGHTFLPEGLAIQRSQRQLTLKSVDVSVKSNY